MTASLPPSGSSINQSDDWLWRRISQQSLEGCWPWLDTYDRPVSSQSDVRDPRTGERSSPHRLAWELHYEQEIPFGGRLWRACSSDVYCCNPSHYELRLASDFVG